MIQFKLLGFSEETDCVCISQSVVMDLEALREADPEDKAVVQLIAVAKKQRKVQDSKDKQLFGKMFSGKTQTPTSA